VWNIRQGGVRRRERIADAIIAHSPDIVALIEFVPSTAQPMLRLLRDTGFHYCLSTRRNGFDYCVCVLSKTPISVRPSGIPALDDSGAWLEVHVPEYGFSFAAVHAPTKRGKMRAFLDAILQVASAGSGAPFLFVGDFNTGIGPADGPLKNYGDVDRFLALQSAGFGDAWRHVNGDLIEHTYVFPRTGKRYRIDHALASRGLLPRIHSCRYSHEERITGVSDHSVLVVDIED
jgi:exonuclease III